MTLARAGGAEVMLLDKSSYPRVKVCGSGLSPNALRVLDALGLMPAIEPLHLAMRGMTVKGPGGATVHLRGAKGAWVVPRRELDHAVVRAAVAAGAVLHEDTKVTALLRDAAGQVRGVETSQGTLEADLVVCANGSPSRFEIEPSPRYGIRTIMGWWKGVALAAPDEGAMIWDRRLDGYYAWAFPEPGGLVNLGLTIPEHSPHAEHLKALFQALLDEHFGEELRHAERVGKWMGHPATVTTRIGQITEARALWCGEAARLVCPGSVEGIGFALESGMLAAQHLRRFDPSTGMTRLQQTGYRASVARHMLPKLWAGEGLVRVMRSPSTLGVLGSVFSPQWLSERAAMLVGESRSQRPTPPAAHAMDGRAAE